MLKRETTERDAKQGGVAMSAHRPAPKQEVRERLLEEFMEQGEKHLGDEGRVGSWAAGRGQRSNNSPHLGSLRVEWSAAKATDDKRNAKQISQTTNKIEATGPSQKPRRSRVKCKSKVKSRIEPDT